MRGDNGVSFSSGRRESDASPGACWSGHEHVDPFTPSPLCDSYLFGAANPSNFFSPTKCQDDCQPPNTISPSHRAGRFPYLISPFISHELLPIAFRIMCIILFTRCPGCCTDWSQTDIERILYCDRRLRAQCLGVAAGNTDPAMYLPCVE